MSNTEPVEPYRGDPSDLVAHLTWLKGQVQCTRPGREMVYAEFDLTIGLAEKILEVNESMRRDLAKDAPRMQLPPPFEQPDPTLLKPDPWRYS